MGEMLWVLRSVLAPRTRHPAFILESGQAQGAAPLRAGPEALGAERSPAPTLLSRSDARAHWELSTSSHHSVSVQRLRKLAKRLSVHTYLVRCGASMMPHPP